MSRLKLFFMYQALSWLSFINPKATAEAFFDIEKGIKDGIKSRTD